jgi:adhesin transport system outer membrane protein
MAAYQDWVLRGILSEDYTPPAPAVRQVVAKPWQSFQKTAMATAAETSSFQMPSRSTTLAMLPEEDVKSAEKKPSDNKLAEKKPESAKPAEKNAEEKIAELASAEDKVSSDKATLLPLMPRRVIPPQKALSVGAAIQKAIGRHPDIVTAQSVEGREKANVLVAQSVQYPQISFGGGVGSSFKNDKASGTISNSVGLNAEQLVYDFGRSKNIIKAAQSSEVRARAEIDVTSERVAAEVAMAFVAAQRAQMLKESAEDSLASLQRMRDIIKLRSDSGVSDQADLVLANVRVDGAESDLIGATATEQAARSTLISLVGGSYQGLKVVDPLLESIDRSLKRSMLDKHPSIIAALQEVEATKYQLNAEKASYYPSVSVGGSYSYDPSKGDTSSNVMLSIKGNIYQGGATRARYRVDSIRLTNSTLFDASVEDASGAASQKKVIEQQIKRAIDSRDLFFEQYQLGKRSLTDLLNSDAAIYGAINTKIEIEYRYRAAIIRKAQALGVLRSRLTGAQI